MVGSGKSETVYSRDTVADVAPVSAVCDRVVAHVCSVAAAIRPNQSGAVNRTGLCAAPYVAPSFVIRVERILRKTRAGTRRTYGDTAADNADARNGDRAERNCNDLLKLVHCHNLRFPTSMMYFVTVYYNQK